VAPNNPTLINRWLVERYNAHVEAQEWRFALDVVDLGLAIIPDKQPWLKRQLETLAASDSQKAIATARTLMGGQDQDIGVELVCAIMALMASHNRTNDFLSALKRGLSVDTWKPAIEAEGRTRWPSIKGELLRRRTIAFVIASLLVLFGLVGVAIELTGASSFSQRGEPLATLVLISGLLCVGIGAATLLWATLALAPTITYWTLQLEPEAMRKQRAKLEIAEQQAADRRKRAAANQRRRDENISRKRYAERLNRQKAEERERQKAEERERQQAEDRRRQQAEDWRRRQAEEQRRRQAEEQRQPVAASPALPAPKDPPKDPPVRLPSKPVASQGEATKKPKRARTLSDLDKPLD
jgi:flagellar biosynthesis GTPase FlhF